MLWLWTAHRSCIHHINAHILNSYTFFYRCFVFLILWRFWLFFFLFSSFEALFACIADVDIFFSPFNSNEKKKWRRMKTKKKEEIIHTRLGRLQHKNENENRNNTQVWKRLRHNRVRMFCICAHFNTCNSKMNGGKKSQFWIGFWFCTHSHGTQARVTSKIRS